MGQGPGSPARAETAAVQAPVHGCPAVMQFDWPGVGLRDSNRQQHERKTDGAGVVEHRRHSPRAGIRAVSLQRVAVLAEGAGRFPGEGGAVQVASHHALRYRPGLSEPDAGVPGRQSPGQGADARAQRQGDLRCASHRQACGWPASGKRCAPVAGRTRVGRSGRSSGSNWACSTMPGRWVRPSARPFRCSRCPFSPNCSSVSRSGRSPRT